MIRVRPRHFLIVGLVLVLLLSAYSYFFRTYLTQEEYLEMALDATGHDPAITNPDLPEFEVLWYKKHIAIHIVFLTVKDDQLGSISMYIDPFAKKVEDLQYLDYVMQIYETD